MGQFQFLECSGSRTTDKAQTQRRFWHNLDRLGPVLTNRSSST
jgi:hypothetical protein